MKEEYVSIYLPYDLYFFRLEEDVEKVSSMPIKYLGTFHKQETQLNSLTFKSLIRGEYKEPKLILRSLSDLKVEMEIDGDYHTPYDYLELEKYLDIDTFSSREYWVNYMPYEKIKKLIEWHFDVNLLIEKGLAVDTNTLDP